MGLLSLTFTPKHHIVGDISQLYIYLYIWYIYIYIHYKPLIDQSINSILNSHLFQSSNHQFPKFHQ
jgi:hypothetical protein